MCQYDFFLLLALLEVSSCASLESVSPLVDGKAEIMLKMAPAVGTAAGYESEGYYGDVGCYVFDKSSGDLEDVVSAVSGAQGISLELLPGDKEVWVLYDFDCSRFRTCRCLQDFIRGGARLEDYCEDGMTPMAGNAEVSAYPACITTVTVRVSRFAAKLRVKEIRNSLSGPLAGMPIRIKSFFLSNVLSECLLDGEPPDRYVLQNCSGRDGDGNLIDAEAKSYLPRLTYRSIEEELGCGGSLYPDESLVFLPFSDVVSTRLVVEAQIGGSVYYYPVDLSGAERNHSYDLVLEITRPGSQDPDSFSFGAAGSFSFELQAFDDGADGIYIIY